MKILSFQDIFTLNVWEAKYAGDRRVYNVKVYMDEGNYLKKSSCDCGSYFFPCKHINNVKNSILRQRKIEKYLKFLRVFGGK
jgi:hypothetical protein